MLEYYQYQLPTVLEIAILLSRKLNLYLAKQIYYILMAKLSS